MKTGIDVSVHQGMIDWEKVTAEFAMIRAGISWYEGGMDIDKQFFNNVAGVQKAGIPWGVFIYAYDKTPAAARIAANKLADLLDKYQIPYPVAYDIEEPQYFTMGKATNTAICKAFLETLEKRGYYAMLYTFTNFAKNYLNMEELSAYDFWVADVSGKMGWTGAYGIWQHSWEGNIPGIVTSVDLDRAYKDYPSIIREAGLNGYGKNVDDVDQVEGENGSDDQEETAALKEKINALRVENDTLQVEINVLKAQIAAARKALE